MAWRELRPVRDDTADYDKVAARILGLLKVEIYAPLMRELRLNPDRVLRNAADPLDALYSALRSGAIHFEQGNFSGKFSAATSKALRDVLGATWNTRTKTFYLAKENLTPEARAAILTGEQAFAATLERIDERLAQILPAKIAERLNISKVFDTIIWKTDKTLSTTLKALTVPANLTPERAKRLSDEWQNNLQLEIKNFTETQVQSLRERVKANVFSGKRYEGLVAEIQASYGVSSSKAKFLAQQETKLLTTKYKEARYAEAGVLEYKWRTVVGSPKHPVRPSHKALENKVFRFDQPPITTAPGEPVRRNNPGQDFNCRCVAVPVVRF